MIELLIEAMEACAAFGAWSLVAVAVLFFVGALVGVPRSPAALACGMVFGLYTVPLIVVAATAGGVLCFLGARSVLRRPFLAFVAPRPRLAAVVDAVEQEGWRLAALLRVASPLPATLQSYLFGLTGLPLSLFVLITAVCSLPTVLFWTYVGTLGRSALEGSGSGLGATAISLLGIVTLGLAMLFITRRVRARLAAMGPALDAGTASAKG